MIEIVNERINTIMQICLQFDELLSGNQIGGFKIKFENKNLFHLETANQYVYSFIV